MLQPRYRHASYEQESVTLENKHISVRFFKRLCGWGFAEVYTPEGKLMAILDHFGELLIRDQEIPVRMEGDTYELKREGNVQTLSFPVVSTMAQPRLTGTSFDPWIHFPFIENVMEGTVTFTLGDDEAIVRVNYAWQSKANLYLHYLRGPWLLVGEESFGIDRDDALLPGVDWPINQEWSSGPDFIKGKWANRCIPHPNKVTAPVMAVSKDGDGIGLSWNFHQVVTRWFNQYAQHPQPVFASPNFVERRPNSLMGITLPEVREENEENKPFADVPLMLQIGQFINLDAEIFLVKGNSVQTVVDWVKRTGLPKDETPRFSLGECLDRIANSYNTNFWHEGEGFGMKEYEGSWVWPSPRVPEFLRRYIVENADTQLGKELTAKIAWCDAQKQEPRKRRKYAYGFNFAPKSQEDVDEMRKYCDEILTWQHEDGSFRYEPMGRHYEKDDYVVARLLVEPLGLDGAAALFICTEPAHDLLLFYRETKEQKYGDAARRALDYAMRFTRPEGAEGAETPTHAANLQAAGVGSNTYYLAYEIFKDEKYREKAIYWHRCLLAFTHLWEPRHNRLLYSTKPCLCGSDWYLANWVRDHVQWEVLRGHAQHGHRQLRRTADNARPDSREYLRPFGQGREFGYVTANILGDGVRRRGDAQAF